MKKTLLMMILLVLSAALLACSPTQSTETQEITEDDLVGVYTSYSLRDPLGIYTDFLMYQSGKAVTRDAITLEKADSDLVFQDNTFKGVCELSDDRSLILKRREVITTGPTRALAETMLQQSPIVFYTTYKDYLISDSKLTLLQVTGELPIGKNSDCIVFLDHPTLTDYHITFNKNGSCQIDCFGSSWESYHYEGTYSFDGNVVLLTFSSGTAAEDSLTGSSEMALYIEGDNIYGDVYKKGNS